MSRRPRRSSSHCVPCYRRANPSPVPHAMLSTRSRLGHPILRLVVQAITIGLGSIRLASHFSEQLSSLAEHVEEYEEYVDAETHVCGFEMRDMWNVEGAEDYWSVDDKQRPRYTPLWSYEYS
ncbi:hypothetical protein LXA43DRAFT_1105556 [Ganoderma leucocontextum]|nr:hypothetical protein LXA43DRAFT_1105556 [Ganoderma leucocontextum]